MWLAAVVLLAAPGTVVWKLPLVAKMNRAARLALAFATGLLITALILYGYALVGIHWSRVSIAVPLVAFTVAGLRSSDFGFGRAIQNPKNGSTVDRILIGLFLIVTIYAVLDARATCGDLIYIWGPKAQAFTTAGTIDTKFLSFPHYYLMHPDYPPFVALIYSWGSIAAHRFSWWGAMLLSPLVLASIVAVFSGFGVQSRSLVLVTAILAFTFVFAYLGGANLFLIFFEAIAVVALTFAPESRDARWIAAGALAGGAFAKVEGAAFAVIVAAVFLVVERRPWRALALVVPTGMLIGTWVLFAWHYKFLDQYARAHSSLYWRLLTFVVTRVLHRAAYRVAWLPWIAAAAALFLGRSWRRAAFPLLVTAGSLSATIFFYLHEAAPTFWIDGSADRILLTPLVCLVVASAVAADPVQADGLADPAVAAAS